MHNNPLRSTILFLGLFLSLIIVSSCDRSPTAAFSYKPTSNPEAGDTIFFINESEDATQYEWDFGNEVSSVVDSPYTFYESPGYYTIQMMAINEAGSDSAIQKLYINSPTIMAFYVSMPDSITPLEDANVWVYDNEADWDDFEEPQFFNLTDEEGFVMFQNLESIPYYITIFKETSDGVYLTGGYTDALTLNEANVYDVNAEFISDDDLALSSGKSILKVLKRLPPNIREMKLDNSSRQ